MGREEIPSQKKTFRKNRTLSTFISDLKSICKASVLIANVLPVFTGFWLALHFSNATFLDYWDVFFVTIIGSTLVMAGALVINNWYDVDIDQVMDRTKNRPTVTGHFSLKTVLILGIILTIIGFILLLFISLSATLWAFIGWFTYVILYTMWSKRRYTWNTIIGSVSGAVTPFIGWTVIAPSFHIVPIMLFLILFIWQMPHTYAIAMRKCKEYTAAKVAMLPVVHGFQSTKRHMIVYMALLFPLPFFLIKLGTGFVIIATCMNLAWFIVCLRGFFIKDDFKWAYLMFLFSVNYLTIIFLTMIIVTFPFL